MPLLGRLEHSVIVMEKRPETIPFHNRLFNNKSMAARKLLYRTLRACGLKIERYRDPFADIAKLTNGEILRVIDGGAFRGTASEEFLKLFPRAEVHAFEPQSDLYSQLLTRSNQNPRWHVHNLALSDITGEAPFFVPSAAFTASLLTPGASFGEAKTVTVQLTTLDEWSTNSGPIDILKLDLQGAELKALQGGIKTLPNVQLVLCEVNFVRRYENCCLYHEIAALLETHGLHLHRFYDIHTNKSGGWEFADAIFIRNSSR